MPVQTQILTRRGAAATWTSTNPTLGAGEIGFESDTNKFKIGTGSTAWVSLPYASNVSPLTTKGDLYTYSTDNARLAVGANGETLVADSSTSTGLRYTNNFAAGKNKIINGDFNVNQRAFTSTTTTGTYGFDRWSLQLSGATGTYSAETFTLGAAPVAGYEAKNFARLAVTTGNDNCALQNRMESVRTFAGQTVTVSFWAKGTNPTTDGGLYVTLAQVFGSGGSPSAAVNTVSPKFVLTANWTRYSLTLNVPSISGKTLGTAGDDYLAFVIGQAASVSSDSYTLDLWGVQVEAGSVATAFQTATGTIQGELAACQRYYFKDGVASISDGYAQNATNVFQRYFYPVMMRTTPTLIQTGAAIASQNTSATTFTVDATGTNAIGASIYFLTGPSIVYSYLYRSIEWSAEL